MNKTIENTQIETSQRVEEVQEEASSTQEILEDKKTLSEQDKDLLDALHGVILNCANLAVVKLEGREEFSNLKQLFGGILIKADTELSDALKEGDI